MPLAKEKKATILSQFAGSAKNTGSIEGQIALFTERIKHLTDHLKDNRKDFNTQLALQKMVGKRKSLIAYLKNKDIERYRAIIKELGLRK
jgi:small subunit ribosomal protein S15